VWDFDEGLSRLYSESMVSLTRLKQSNEWTPATQLCPPLSPLSPFDFSLTLPATLSMARTGQEEATAASLYLARPDRSEDEDEYGEAGDEEVAAGWADEEERTLRFLRLSHGPVDLVVRSRTSRRLPQGEEEQRSRSDGEKVRVLLFHLDKTRTDEASQQRRPTGALLQALFYSFESRPFFPSLVGTSFLSALSFLSTSTSTMQWSPTSFGRARGSAISVKPASLPARPRRPSSSLPFHRSPPSFLFLPQAIRADEEFDRAVDLYSTPLFAQSRAQKRPFFA